MNVRPGRPTVDAARRHAADRAAIEELNACFAQALDRSAPDALADLFTEDACYRSGARELQGRQAIVGFFEDRLASGPRTTRHLCSGLRLFFSDDAAMPFSAEGESVWISYAANAAPPIDEVVPFMIADFSDVYVLEPDGHWRIARRVIEPVFRNAAAGPAGSR
jgi:hypothetical protein